MLKHTDQLYRLAELPAFIEEALCNVSLKGIIASYKQGGRAELWWAIQDACLQYAEQWVDDWMARASNLELWAGYKSSVDPEIRAIEAGVKLFSNPDCKAGLPE